MSSGFVSGGTIDKPVERDDEWRAAQAELEAKRREKEDRDKQHDGKSLFEVLEANKGDARRPHQCTAEPTDMVGRPPKPPNRKHSKKPRD